MTSEEIEKLFGVEYVGFKAQAAIDKLLQEKQGHIKAAFWREEIGNIDLVWGNFGFGLIHLIMERQKQGVDPVSFLSDLAEVIEKGQIVLVKENRFAIIYKGKKAVIAPNFRKKGKVIYNHPVLMTAYRTRLK